MSYQVTARKWRPMVFEDVVGQTHVTTTLRNAIATNRVAHAYIFSGQRGCGKTTTARILAKALNCLSPKDFNPDNTCEVCREITDGRSLDVIEIDGASNRGVEEIRNLRDSVRYNPSRGKRKIYIIDEVHMLTKEAFNALLKTLEEPPSYVLFIFATTEVHKVPATILSRCQRFDFRRITIEEITSRLRFIAKEEKVTIDDDALMVIAKKGDGSLRDAQSIFDQVRSFCGNEISHEDALKTLNAVDLDVYFKVTGLIRQKDQKGGIQLVDEIIKSGYDLREFVGGLSEHFRNLLVVSSTGSGDLVEASDHFREKYGEESKHFTEGDLLRLVRQANDLEQSIRWASQPRYKLEAGLLQMIAMESAVRVQELLKQIEELKKRLNGTSGVSAVAAPQSDIKVVGTVGAGYLRSAAATTVRRESIGVTSAGTFGSPSRPSVLSGARPVASSATPSSQSGNGTGRTVSSDEAFARWQEWVGEVRKEKISVGSILDQSRLVEVTNGLVRISCPDEYHASTIKRHREYLTETFRKLTGYNVIIEPIIHSAQDMGQSIVPDDRSVLAVEKNPPNVNHPVLEALKRELGVEQIN